MLALASIPAPALHARAIPRTLKIAVGIDADTLDPAALTTGLVMGMADYIYERLVTFDYTQNRVLPRLATQWQVSTDGLTYTFRLRSGVTFHDGAAFNAEAVKFTFDRLLDPQTRAPLREPLTIIKETQVVDPMTVRFILSRPDPLFLTYVTHWVASIISPTTVRRAGANLGRDPTGAATGPYMFKEWARGSHILYVRNPNYWGRKPVFEEVMLRIAPDAGVRETMLLAGDAHMAVLPPAPDVRRLREHPGYAVVEAATSRIVYIGMNTQWGAFKDARVRRAMNYAVNKRAILASVLFDLGTVADSPCVSMVSGYTPVQPGGWPFDPGKARQLLREAGYPDGFEVDFITPTGRLIQDFQFAQAIAAQLRNFKVRANLRTMDWPTYVATIDQPLERSSLRLFVLAWVPFPLDCWSVFHPMFHSSQHPPRGFNSTFYKNVKIDEFLDRARTEMDPLRRKELLKEAQTLVWHDAPWIFLWSQKWYVATVRNLEGVSITPFEMWDAIYATWK
ncbi:MAG: ABC transporter substrate-binding protein [Armatimonadetes bacterium]|nr:ABC transporter substrate-binding protein [Armatimonadota bacterium]